MCNTVAEVATRCWRRARRQTCGIDWLPAVLGPLSHGAAPARARGGFRLNSKKCRVLRASLMSTVALACRQENSRRGSTDGPWHYLTRALHGEKRRRAEIRHRARVTEDAADISRDTEETLQ